MSGLLSAILILYSLGGAYAAPGGGNAEPQDAANATNAASTAEAIAGAEQAAPATEGGLAQEVLASVGDGSPSPSSAPETLAVESVEVLNGGAYQALYRSQHVTEQGGRYYTDRRGASITDPRVFRVSAQFQNSGADGAPLIASDSPEAYAAFIAGTAWTYGGKPLSEWRKAASSGINGPFTGAPFITLQSSGLTKQADGSYKLEAFIRFDTPLWSFSNSPSIPSNIPYAGYPNVTQSGNNSFHPQLIDTLVGDYELAVSHVGPAAETRLGSRVVRLALYDSYHTWNEIDRFAKDLKAESEAGGHVVNGRYVSVQSLAKTLRGNDIWNVVIADSQASVEEYLNVTKPLIETNPEALKGAIAGGSQKLAIYFNVIHADEAPGIDANVRAIESFVRDDVISFYSKDEVEEITNVSNGYAREKEGSGRTLHTYSVADALDKFIIVVTITSNTDGKELQLRGNEFGLDHNRQSVAQRTVESVALTSDIRKWNPVEFNEYHGYTSSMLIMPGTGPHAPFFEHDLLYPNALDNAHFMGRAILGSTPLRSYTVPYDYWTDGWDDGGRGASYFYAYLTGSLGRTIEIPYANEDAVDAALTATKSLIYNSLQNRDTLYLNKLEYARRALANEDLKDKVDKYIVNPYQNNAVVGRPRTLDANGEERNYFPDYYIIPADPTNQFNIPEIYETLIALERNGALIRRSTEAVAYEDAVYPAGSYVIDLRQYSRAFIQAALSEGHSSSYFTDTYAEITVNLPALRGFKAVPVWSAGLFDGKSQPVPRIEKPAVAPDAAEAPEYLVIKSGSVDAVRLVNRLLNGDKPVRVITSHTAEGSFGDYVARSADIAAAQEGLAATAVPFGVGLENPSESLSSVSKPLVKPRIAAIGSPLTYSYPQGSNVTYFKLLLPYLEFDEDSYSITTSINNDVIPGYNVVVNDNVSLSSALINGVINSKIPYVGIRNNGVSSAANISGFGLGATTASPGSAEAVFKVDYSPTSPISSFFAENDRAYLISARFFGALPQGAKKLITVRAGEDNFVGGWWRNAPSSPTGYDHALLDGKTTALYALAGSGKDVPVTLFASDASFRFNTRAYWPLIAQAIFLGASGVIDTPRPYVSADAVSHAWSDRSYSVGLTATASDAVGSSATVTKQLYKVTSAPSEPAYSASDSAWKPFEGAAPLPVQAGELYLHWYAENSEGATNQGSYGPYRLGPTIVIGRPSEDATKVSAGFSIRNDGAQDASYNYILAVYDSLGRLIHYDSKPAPAKAGETVSGSLSVPLEGGATAKAFLWDSRFIPLSPAAGLDLRGGGLE